MLFTTEDAAVLGKDGQDADASSAAGFPFSAALVNGGTALGLLFATDYLYTHGVLPTNRGLWCINQ